MWVWGSDVPVFGGDEVLDEFDHCDGFAELSCSWNCTGGGCVSVAIA